MPLDEIRSEGLRPWNMDKDVEYQYETLNGLPVYYGGDMYDAEDPEEYDPLEMARAAYVEDYNFDVPEGMELITYTRHRPDGGNTRGVNVVDMIPMCRTVSGVTRCEQEDSSDMLRTDTTELEESDSEDFCLWTDLWDEEDCPVSNDGSIVDNSLCISIRDNLSSVDVACVCTRGTPPEACSAGRISLALIGRLGSVGGSVSHADWSRVIGAVDTSPGGVW